MALPSDRVELQIGGEWTDITPDVYDRDPIVIRHGRSSATSRTQPSKASLTLNNRSGKYSSRNPMYYGRIGRNTPIRCISAGGQPYLYIPEDVAGRATTPDHASLDITGDIDVRVEVMPQQWTGVGIGYELIGKYVASGNQRSWRLIVTGEGELLLTWSPDGASIIEHRSPVLRPLGPRMAVRAALDVDNGSGGYTLTYYIADSLAGPWVEIGQTVTTSGTTSIYSSTASVELGDLAALVFTNHERRIYAAQVRDGIDGTVVATPDLTAQTPGTTSFTDGAGRTWTLSAGATVSDEEFRFQGAVAAWPARWDATGSDVWVPIEAAGALRRLTQGKKALPSTLRRRLPSQASLLAYWPCEESEGASRAYSPLGGVAPLSVAGFDFSQDDTLGGSSALPIVDPGGSMLGTVPGPASPSTTWALCMPYRVDGTAPGSEQEMLSWQTSGTIRRWRITMGATSSHILGYDAIGTLVVNEVVATGSELFEGWWRLEFLATQNGGNIDWKITWTQVGGANGVYSSSVAGTLGQITSINTVFGSGLPNIRIGHLTVWSADVIGPAYDSADTGFDGESATERMERLAVEEAATVSLVTYHGDPTSTAELLGPQSPDALLPLLQESADCDGGILHEDLTDARLVYRDRHTLYNQPVRLTLDYAAAEVGVPLEPVEDDEATRNDITVSRRDGSDGHAVDEDGTLSVLAPPYGVGIYDEQVTLNLHSDEQTEPIAGWLLHLGTWDEARYPTVRIQLHATPHLIPAFLKLRPGDRIRIINPPPWLPPGPIDLHVQGWAEKRRQYTWDADLICSPAGPWTIGVLDDTARLDTEFSVIDTSVDATTTSVDFTTFTGPHWVDSATYPTDFPFDVLAGGERMTVTAITGTGATQTATVTRSVNGIVKSHDAGTDVRLADPTYLAL
ncbi:hypothetical protein OG393_20940 [Streptomyces sp. NBC_01216]|uniref:hypothetical protein n=1 Tax=Streptomyces sp. NBC_01216 TaxID=2903778 RepID=UPI002E15B7FE|nr:hypothetical protein OG393_20940 [Streptomyces sp. NBC_01216]